MTEASQLWIGRLAGGVEILAAIVIGLAALQAFLRVFPVIVLRNARQEGTVALRLALGRWLGVGLEFALAADILRTAVAPTWTDIGQLAAIAALRTALNFTLEREIERVEPRAEPASQG